MRKRPARKIIILVAVVVTSAASACLDFGDLSGSSDAGESDDASIDASTDDASTSDAAGDGGSDAAEDAPIAIVQSVANAVFGGPTSVSTVTPSPETRGNLNVVAISWQADGYASAILSITDTDGNTYELAVVSKNAAALGHAIYYAKNINGGVKPNTVTITTILQPGADSGADDPDVAILEISGLDRVAPYETMNQASGSSATATSGNVITVVPRSLLITAGGVDYGNTFADASTAFTLVPLTGESAWDLVGYQVVQSTGTYASSIPLPGSGLWVLQIAAFK